MSIPIGTPIEYNFFSGAKERGVIGKPPKNDTCEEGYAWVVLEGGGEGWGRITKITILREENEL